MTIEWRRGDMFESGAEALVCAANAQGRLGAGQALEVKRRWPQRVRLFAKDRHHYGDVVMIEDLGRPTEPVLFFACVKDDQREPSHYGWVRQCCERIAMMVREVSLRSVGVPALGYGLGQLEWRDVRPMLVEMAEAVPDTRWLLYEPLEPLRWELAQAIAARLNQHPAAGGIRANPWRTSNGRLVSVYLAGGNAGIRLGRIDIDGQLRLTARGETKTKREAATAWIAEAEDVRAEVLRGERGP